MESIVSPLEDFNVPPFDLPSTAEDNTFPLFLVNNQEVLLRDNILGDLLYEAFADAIAEMPDVWDDETDYAVDAQVVEGNNIWKSLQTPNLNQPVEAGVFWELVEADNRWLKLKNGTTFIVDGKSYKWKGMKPMLVGWHIAKWLEYQNDAQSSIGTVLPKAENSLVTSPVYRIKRGYNTASDLVRTLLAYLYHSEEVYYDVVEDEWSDIKSYIVAKFKPLGKVNEFDL